VRVAESALLQQQAGLPAILDSNLLLLRWCADFDLSLVHRFKRLNNFDASDVKLLDEVLAIFPVLSTTPHVLTEVSNLANSLPEFVKEDWSEYFATRIQSISERWTPASSLAANPLFGLGITDTALASLAQSHVILTIDFPLSNSLPSRGLRVVNFTQLRGIGYA
jgi:hypothetical protein